MNAAGQALGAAAFSLRHAFAAGLSDDVKFALACACLIVILGFQYAPHVRRWFGKPGKPRLSYSQNGREGSLRFSDGRTEFDMYWAFGGGDAIATISVPTEAEWPKVTGLPLAERLPILHEIAKQVVRDQTVSGRNRYEISPSYITIYT